MMNLKRILALSVVGMIVLAGAVQAQTTVFSEPFNGDSKFTVTKGVTGSDGTDNYFQITDGSNINKSYSGVNGSFLAGQDTDDGQIGSGGSAPVQIEWTGIDITGQSNLYFNGDFGEVLDGNGDIDDTDSLVVEYQIDGGGYEHLIAFQNDGTEFNTDFLEDTNFDGIGDGANITSSNGELMFFTKSIPGTGSTLDLRFTAHVNSGDEDFAVDEFVVTADGPLPVELASFDVTAKENRAVLAWTTGTETNNAGFAVQHRTSNGGWSKSGFVKGAGTTTEAQSYRFTTDALVGGTHTFRLKQIDTDGTVHYSEPQTVTVRGEGGLQLLSANPIPKGQPARLSVQVATEQSVTVGLYDVLGQRVRTIVTTRAAPGRPVRATFSTTGLASGVYFLRAQGRSIQATRRLTVLR